MASVLFFISLLALGVAIKLRLSFGSAGWFSLSVIPSSLYLIATFMLYIEDVLTMRKNFVTRIVFVEKGGVINVYQ